jgi:rifampicin phosphotransferase
LEQRRAAHERLSALPPYPTLINGRFDPFAWAADPDRRGDLFDAHATGTNAPSANGSTL